MTETQTQAVLATVGTHLQSSACQIDDMPAMYGRLLSEHIELLKALDINPYMSLPRMLLLSFDPRYVHRLWKSRYLRDFLNVPNAVQQELPRAAELLRAIQPLADVQLLALARCSSLNVGKLTNRLLLGGVNKPFVALAAILALGKGLKEALGVDLAGYVPSVAPILLPALVGLAIAVIFNLVTWYQSLRLVRAVDDIISIAVTARRLKS